MLARYATLGDLAAALAEVNKRFLGNITMGSFTVVSRTTIRFRLGVASSKGPGSRRGIPRDGVSRRINAACWHAHGYFFDALLAINPKAVIITGSRTVDGGQLRITKDGGNWKDYNIGGGAEEYRFMASAACDCPKSRFDRD